LNGHCFGKYFLQNFSFILFVANDGNAQILVYAIAIGFRRTGDRTADKWTVRKDTYFYKYYLFVNK
jgi:hypothetical protein